MWFAAFQQAQSPQTSWLTLYIGQLLAGDVEAWALLSSPSVSDREGGRNRLHSHLHNSTAAVVTALSSLFPSLSFLSTPSYISSPPTHIRALLYRYRFTPLYADGRMEVDTLSYVLSAVSDALRWGMKRSFCAK